MLMVTRPSSVGVSCTTTRWVPIAAESSERLCATWPVADGWAAVLEAGPDFVSPGPEAPGAGMLGLKPAKFPCPATLPIPAVVLSAAGDPAAAVGVAAV